MKPKPHQQFIISRTPRDAFQAASMREMEIRKARGYSYQKPSEEQKERGKVRRKLDDIKERLELDRESREVWE